MEKRGCEAELTGWERGRHGVTEQRCVEVESDENSPKVQPSVTSMAVAAAASIAPAASVRVTHPFGHVASVWVVVMVLQDHHGGDDRHPHDDHDAGKVLT